MGIMAGYILHYPVKWKTQFLVDQLAMHPDWRICMEIEPKHGIQSEYRLRRLICVLKRWLLVIVEFTNPTYAQPYCYNISGESIIRQFQYGIAKINKHFPGSIL